MVTYSDAHEHQTCSYNIDYFTDDSIAQIAMLDTDVQEKLDDKVMIASVVSVPASGCLGDDACTG